MHIEETSAWQASGAFKDIASKLLWVAANSTALKVLNVELYHRSNQAPWYSLQLGMGPCSGRAARGLQTAAAGLWLPPKGSRHFPGHSQPQALDA